MLVGRDASSGWTGSFAAAAFFGFLGFDEEAAASSSSSSSSLSKAVLTPAGALPLLLRCGFCCCSLSSTSDSGAEAVVAFLFVELRGGMLKSGR